MKVRELIEELECYPDDLEVKLAHQPSWPFEYTIGDVVEAKLDDEDPSKGNAVFIGEGEQEGYLPYDASCSLGWRQGLRAVL